MNNTQKPLSMDITRRIPKKSESGEVFNPYKGQEYRLFLIWRSLPVTLRGISGEQAEEKGVNDPELIELIQCRTQNDFAKRFGISIDTLTDWKKKEVPAEFKVIDWRYWAKEFTPEVVNHLLEGIRKNQKADAIKLWLQTVDGFVEETNVNNRANDALDAVAQLIDDVNRKADASDEHRSNASDSEQPATS